MPDIKRNLKLSGALNSNRQNYTKSTKTNVSKKFYVHYEMTEANYN